MMLTEKEIREDYFKNNHGQNTIIYNTGNMIEYKNDDSDEKLGIIVKFLNDELIELINENGYIRQINKDQIIRKKADNLNAYLVYLNRL